MQAISSRMQKEVKMLQSDPPPGVWAGPREESLTQFDAQIQGPVETVYEGGVFKLEVNIPTRYPFEPPKVRFVTPIYHPNIDREGRICLDILNMPPKGAWKPSLNISTVLASIGLLLSDPNSDDGLVAEITQEFKHQRQVFDAKARQSTQRWAVQSSSAEESTSQGGAPQAQKQQDPAQHHSNSPFEEAAVPVRADPDTTRGSQPGSAGDDALQDGRPATENKDVNVAARCNKTESQDGAAPTKRPRLALRK